MSHGGLQTPKPSPASGLTPARRQMSLPSLLHVFSFLPRSCYSPACHFSTPRHGTEMALAGCHQSPPVRSIEVFFFFLIFIYLFMAVLGLLCCARAFSSCGEWGLFFVMVCRLLIVVASLVVEHGL